REIGPETETERESEILHRRSFIHLFQHLLALHDHGDTRAETPRSPPLFVREHTVSDAPTGKTEQGKATLFTRNAVRLSRTGVGRIRNRFWCLELNPTAFRPQLPEFPELPELRSHVMGSGGLKCVDQQHRGAFARSTSAHADLSGTSTGSGLRGTSVSPQMALTSHPPSGPVRRKPIAPAISINTQIPDPERPRSRESATGEGGGDAPSEICLSPSWSDFGGGKKKKEKKRREREKKEREKNHKSESDELRAGDSLAGKRLSKKPPAAMDTQKMPSALRRNSAVSSYSSSPEDAGRLSTEDGRASRLSAGSRRKRRSKSTPGRSAESPSEPRKPGASVVSEAPPQLPKLRGFGWHSRQSSSAKSNAASGGAYEKDVVRFAYSLEASSGADHPGHFTVNYGDDRTTASHKARPLLLGPPSFSRSKTAPDIIRADGRAAGIDTQPPGTRGDGQDGNFLDRLGGGRGRHQFPTAPGKENEDAMRMQPTGQFMSDEFLQISRLHGGGSGSGVQPSVVKSHKDGSSYVHKQRMHQQQLSIAGYQDELAVRDANEKAYGDDSPVAEGPSVASTRSASSESSKQRTPQTSIDSEGRAEDGASLQEQADQYHGLVNEARNATPPSPTHAPQGSRAERILSFRPFQKRGKLSKAPATTKPTPPAATPSAKSSPTFPSSPTANAVPSPTISKADRPLGEPTSPAGNKNLSKSPKRPKSPKSPKSSKSPDKDTAQEDISEKPTLPTHAPTRLPPLSFSIEDDLIPKPIRRSSTDPVLPVTSKQTSTVPDPVDAGVAHESKDHPEVGSPTRNTPRGPRSPPADIKTLPKLPPEIIVEGVNGEGLVHKTSIKRPRSNPNLLSAAASPGMPSLDFLPQLKHQALTKPKRTSPVRPSFTSTPDKISFPASSQFPVPCSPTIQSPGDSSLPSSPDLKLMPRSPLRPGTSVRRRTMGPLSFGTGGGAEGLDAKPVAKLFVICCKCKFWHDLPSNLYELMAVPRKLSRRDSDEGGAEAESSRAGAKEGRLDTMVQCPWCQHPMTTWCCAGWTTVVYLHERHH
ncbi:hypothetical protein MMC29_008135, partial [Sticta canariensis]|nr:hypothetical protein [Sticta canariensis]